MRLSPVIAYRERQSVGVTDGSIMAAIITTHITRNEITAAAHVSSDRRTHAIDIVQPPGIGIEPMTIANHRVSYLSR
jgi:hypothetical protein